MSSQNPYRAARKARLAENNETPDEIRNYLFNTESNPRGNTRTRNQHPYDQPRGRDGGQFNSNYSASLTPPHETMHQLAAANQESLDNTISTLYKAQDVSTETMQMLQQQSEQLANIDRDLSSVNNSLTLSDRVLRGMESLGGSVSNWWKGPPKGRDLTFNQEAARQAQREREEQEERRKKEEKKKRRGWLSWLRGSGSDTESEGEGAERQRRAASRGYDPSLAAVYAKAAEKDVQGRPGSQGDTAGASAATATEEDAVLSFAMRAREAEDEKLDKVGALLDMLKRDAHSMGKELEIQNAQLQHIGAGMEVSQEQIKEQVKRMDKLR